MSEELLDQWEYKDEEGQVLVMTVLSIRRRWAFFIDCLLALSLFMGFFVAIDWYGILEEIPGWYPLWWMGLILLHTLIESTPLRGSLGKYLLKLQIVTTTRRRVGIRKLFLRNIGKFSCLAIGLLPIITLFSREKTTLFYDEWLGLKVIQKA